MKMLCENQNNAYFIALADKVAANVASLKYGVVSVELTVHDGRVVTTTHAVTEKTRTTEKGA